jgi:Ca2+-binding RTX toxin-like protein
MAVIRLGPGNDTRNGTNGADSIFGGDGNDLLRGLNGNDRVFGEFGNDRIFGDAGNDVMNGGPGNDSVTGGIGADNIGGGIGSDRLDPGVDSSRDVVGFVVDTASASGRDSVFNFDNGEDDVNFGRFGNLADLDTNRDGVVSDPDAFASLRNGRLTVDVGGAFGVDGGGQQTITFVGTSFLDDGDIIFA